MSKNVALLLALGIALWGCTAGDDDTSVEDDDATESDDDATGDDDDDATGDDDDDTGDDDTGDDDTDQGVTGEACTGVGECGGIVNGDTECLIGLEPGGEGWEDFVNGYCTGADCTPGDSCDTDGVGRCVQMLYWNPGRRFCLKPCTAYGQCHDAGPGMSYGCEFSITTDGGGYCFPQG